MIIFKQEEYNAWAALNEKYTQLQAEARRDYGKHKDRDKYNRILLDLDRQEANERDRIEAPAKYRTIKNFSNSKIVEDATATIYYHAWRVYDMAEATGNNPDFSTYGGVIDMRIDEHIDMLRERNDGKAADLLWSLIDKYKAGQITKEESEIYKDYELIKVEIPVNRSMAPIATDQDTAVTIKNTVYPNFFISAKDKISNKLFEGAIAPLVETTVETAKKGSTKNISSAITINYDDLQEIKLINRPKGLTAYDREVNDAITSLYVEGGNEIFTDQMIYRVMTGNPGAKLIKTQQDAITQSVAVLRGTILRLDVSPEEATAYPGIKIHNYEGNLLAIERVEMKVKGQVVNAYRINRPPILYTYADGKNQIARIPMEMINTRINKTQETITIQGYLLRRITAMHAPGSQINRTILFNTIFDKLHIVDDLTPEQIRKKKSKVTTNIIRILDEWKEKSFIVDYAINKKGKVNYSITITP